jgi:hypothetical protein
MSIVLTESRVSVRGSLAGLQPGAPTTHAKAPKWSTVLTFDRMRRYGGSQTVFGCGRHGAAVEATGSWLD